MPAAIVLVLGGVLSCFMGHRLFRLVLGLYGFYLGAMITTSSMGAANTWTLVLSAVVGGLVGAVLMYAAYFLGVGLVGAGLGRARARRRLADAARDAIRRPSCSCWPACSGRSRRCRSCGG